MNPSVLFIIASDPRSSARPAEAIRIAAGVGVWKKADIYLYFRDAAVLTIGEFTDDFLDEDNYIRYRPIIREWGRPIYAQKHAALLEGLGEPALAYEEITDEELARLSARTNYVARF